MDDLLRIGLAGCGRIAERGYVPACRDLVGARLTAVADPDLGRAERLARDLGAAAFGSAGEMIVSGEIDALVVATPAGDHLATAALAANAGKPCLVEKPPAPRLAGAVALASLDPAPAIGFNRRFLQGVELAPSIPAEGWLQLDLELRFRRQAWAAHSSRDEALLDAGTHLVDLAAFLTGSPPIAVRAAAVEPERASLELELGRGRAWIACATDRGYAERVEVRDRGGRTVAASATGRLRARATRLRGGVDPLVGSLRRQLAAFVAASRGEPAPLLARAADGLAAMAVVEAARESAQLGGAEITVTVAEPARMGR